MANPYPLPSTPGWENYQAPPYPSWDEQWERLYRPSNAGRMDAELFLSIREEYAQNSVYLAAYHRERRRMAETAGEQDGKQGKPFREIYAENKYYLAAYEAAKPCEKSKTVV